MKTILLETQKTVKKQKPLIHCITNPISINDCANAILAVGAKPIMAEHPEEVADISKLASTLVVNMGNITDTRLKSFSIAAASANMNNVAILIDIVGICCSNLRFNYVNNFIQLYRPRVIKGNISEIKALIGLEHNSKSVDASSKDKVNLLTSKEVFKKLSEFSHKTGASIVATGETDIIVYKDKLYTLHNGCEKLSRITGTGCVSSALIGCFLGFTEADYASILGISALNISSEFANSASGLGSFKISLHDYLSNFTQEELQRNLKINFYDINQL